MPLAETPRLLIIPGLGNSGPDHWQTRWEERIEHSERVDLGSWDNPHRSHWVTKLDLAIAAANAPVFLAAHSLGCLAVAWWAALAAHERKGKVRGALLVAPPDVERDPVHPALARFAPVPDILLPFHALVVASTDDHYATIERSARFARKWGAAFRDIGALGHINADSRLGDWPEGLALLEPMLGRSPPRGEAGRADAAPRLKRPFANH